MTERRDIRDEKNDEMVARLLVLGVPPAVTAPGWGPPVGVRTVAKLLQIVAKDTRMPSYRSATAYYSEYEGEWDCRLGGSGHMRLRKDDDALRWLYEKWVEFNS